MANRDPNTPPRDHTPAIIGGAVAIFGLLVVLAIGLEWTDSPNTMLIIPVLGTTIGAGIVLQLFSLNKNTSAVRAAADVAVAAKAVAEDTNVRTQDIQDSLNGQFEPRVTEIVGKVFDEKFAAFDATLDARIRAGVTAVNANPERERYFDERMRGIVETALDRREVMCKVPPTQARRRR